VSHLGSRLTVLRQILTLPRYSSRSAPVSNFYSLPIRSPDLVNSMVRAVTTEELDRQVRLSVYRHLVRTGQAPALRDTSADVGVDPTAISASLERLDASHVLVLHPTTRELWMAMPFSAVPTGFRVTSGERAWWANCAWDALGISALLQVPAEITTSCTDCGDPPTVRATGRALSDASGLVHFAVPAAAWWEDIGFT
jgi:hypothetical protein